MFCKLSTEKPLPKSDVSCLESPFNSCLPFSGPLFLLLLIFYSHSPKFVIAVKNLLIDGKHNGLSCRVQELGNFCIEMVVSYVFAHISKPGLLKLLPKGYAEFIAMHCRVSMFFTLRSLSWRFWDTNPGLLWVLTQRNFSPMCDSAQTFVG